MRARLLGLLAVPFLCTFAASAAEPCGVLTQAQVGGVLGTSVGAGEKITPTACQWMARKPTGDAIRRLTVQFESADGYEKSKTPLPGITKTAASGIGDDAFYTTVASLTTLTVKKGKEVFVVRLYGVPGADKQKAMEKSLALDVAAKL